MPHESIQEMFLAALRCHQAGQLADAERRYREVLARQADYPDALHNLGVLALQSQHAEAGEELIRRAIAVNPGAAIYHMSLAGAASSAGRLEEAIASYRRAVELSPQSPDFQCSLGLALLSGEQFDEAIAVFHRAIELRPSSGEFHYNLGVALYGKGDRKAAIAAYGHALQLRPDSWQARHNLALALAEEGQLEAAVAGFQLVLAVRPNDGYVLNNLGNAYKTMGQVQEALDCYERAIAIDPANVGWHSNQLLTLHFHAGLDAEHIFKAHQTWPALCGFTPAATAATHGNDRSPDRRLLNRSPPPACRRAAWGRSQSPDA